MKPLYSAQEWHRVDQDTLNFQHWKEWDLMEVASASLFNELRKYLPSSQPVRMVVGTGNNGGDGLAVARMLWESHHPVEVWQVPTSGQPSEAWIENRRRFLGPFQEITDLTQFEESIEGQYVVEAILGIGTHRPVVGKLKEIIQCMNEKASFRIALDLPAGLRADTPTLPLDGIFEADVTLTCHQPKLSLLLSDYAEYVGEWVIAPIPVLDAQMTFPPKSQMFWIDTIENLLPKRDRFGHKGTFGHALLLAGSEAMPGAALLATKACLRTGAGKVTCASAPKVLDYLPLAVPEAIALVEESIPWQDVPKKFQAAAIGPGWTTSATRLPMLQQVLEWPIPLVLDADALNLLAENRTLIPQIPPQTILTPHPKEFERLIGHRWKNDFDKLVFLRQFSVTYQVIVCLKGANTCIALPDGRLLFNSTGNPGMGTAGSGDVLTGMITSWLAQGVSPEKAAILGVFLHGEAGDRAAKLRSERAILASDILESIR